MPETRYHDHRPAETDPLWDTSNEGLARVFGRRTLEQIRQGRDPYEAARLAFTFAARVWAEQAQQRVEDALMAIHEASVEEARRQVTFPRRRVH